MKKIILVFLVIILLTGIGMLIILNKKNNLTGLGNINTTIETPVVEQKKEDVMVIGLEKKEEETKEESPKEEVNTKKNQVTGKDAATLTQEIYSLNSTIGTLYIPKTNLKTEVYCNPDTQKMETMPGFLYTTGGLNKPGITLFVGHNRRNGKMFSNNKKLVEGDEFYFTDYEGTEKKYIIYSKFITSSNDTSFLNNNVDRPTIALSCCTDASDDNRIIIIGRE